MRKRAGPLAEIPPVRGKIIGKWDENSPCEFSRFHLGKRDEILHVKPGYILSHLMGYLA